MFGDHPSTPAPSMSHEYDTSGGNNAYGRADSVPEGNSIRRAPSGVNQSEGQGAFFPQAHDFIINDGQFVQGNLYKVRWKRQNITLDSQFKRK